MTAIVKTESAFKPFSIGINRSSVRLTRQPENKEEAVATASWLIDHGYNIDLGISQINSSNLKRLKMNIGDAFDPCANVAGGAVILTENYKAALSKKKEPQAALLAALSAYNTGNYTGGFHNGYVQKVSDNARPRVTAASAASVRPVIPLIPTSSPAQSTKPALPGKRRDDRDRLRHGSDTTQRSQSAFVYRTIERDQTSSPFVY
jgi:type IV secretion system protein VirB1